MLQALPCGSSAISTVSSAMWRWLVSQGYPWSICFKKAPNGEWGPMQVRYRSLLHVLCTCSPWSAGGQSVKVVSMILRKAGVLHGCTVGIQRLDLIHTIHMMMVYLDLVWRNVILLSPPATFLTSSLDLQFVCKCSFFLHVQGPCVWIRAPATNKKWQFSWRR